MHTIHIYVQLKKGRSWGKARMKQQKWDFKYQSPFIGQMAKREIVTGNSDSNPTEFRKDQFNPEDILIEL